MRHSWRRLRKSVAWNAKRRQRRVERLESRWVLNTAPIIDPIEIEPTAVEGTPVTFTVTATDVETPDGLTFLLDPDETPEGATIDRETGEFSWTPTEAQGGQSWRIVVLVTDQGSETGLPLADAVALTFDVGDVNSAPTLETIEDVTLDEGQTLTVTPVASDSDLPAQTLTFSLEGDVPEGATIDASTGVITWATDEADGPGTYTFTVRVTDDGEGNLSATQTFEVTVNEVNEAPVLEAIANQSVQEGQTFTFNPVATDADLPAQTLTFALGEGAPEGMMIDSSTGAITWITDLDDGGEAYFVTVIVTDDGEPALSDTRTFQVAVIDESNAPVLFNIGDKQVDEGDELTFTAEAAGGVTPYVFSLEGDIPPGAAIDPSTGVFLWTPTEEQGPGTYEITIRVTDSADPTQSDSETITITVGEINQSPDLADIPDAEVVLGGTLTFTATATDPDLPVNTLTYSLDDSAPEGATIDPTTGVFSWTPTAGQVGSFTIIVLVTDNGSPALADSETFTVTVTATNLPPALGTIGNQTGSEGEELTFTALAVDPDSGDTLTFSLEGDVPEGAAIDPTTGVFTWTPTEEQGPGEYSFDVVVTDNGDPVLTDREAITITVTEANVAPSIDEILDQTVTEGQLLTVDVNATDTDLPAQTLTYSLTAGPEGAAIDPATGVITWTPGAADGPGSVLFTVTVSDGTDTSSRNFNVTVEDANTPPELAEIEAQTVDEGATITFTASATDADGDTVAYSLTGAVPEGAAIDPVTGVFTWVTDEADGQGTYTFDVVATDDGSPLGTAVRTVTLTVNELNQAPTLDPISETTVNEGELVTVTPVATDADLPAQTLTFSLTASPAGATIDPSTGVITWTPGEEDGGTTAAFTVEVSDGTATASQSFNVVVGEVNEAPAVEAIEDATITELEAYTYQVVATDADLPAQTLAYSLEPGSPAGMTIDPATGLISWTPDESQGGGAFDVTVTVSDGVATTSESFTLTVDENPNTQPTLQPIDDVTQDEGTLLTFTAVGADVDDPPQALTYSLDAGAPAAATIDPSTGVFSWQIGDVAGTQNFTITVRVTDELGASAAESFTVTVNDINTPPFFHELQDYLMYEGDNFSHVILADDIDDGQTLSFVFEPGAQAGMLIAPNTGLIEWNPTESFGPGQYTVTVRVTDDHPTFPLSATHTFVFHVEELAEAPSLEPISVDPVGEGQTLSVSAVASDVDLPVEVLTFSLDAGPAGAVIDPLTGLVVWTPGESDGGSVADFTVRVTDEAGLYATQSFQVTVEETNEAPVISALADQVYIVDATLTYAVSASDADLPAQTLSYSLVGPPANAAIGPDGVFTFSPDGSQSGLAFAITVEVSDGTASTQGTFAITQFQELVQQGEDGAIGDGTIQARAGANESETLQLLNSGDSSQYTLNVPTTAKYRLVARYSNQGGGDTVEVLVDGVSIGGFTTDDTGSWESFTDAAPLDAGVLEAGAVNVTFVLTSSSGGFELDQFRLVPVDFTDPGFTSIPARGPNAAREAISAAALARAFDDGTTVVDPSDPAETVAESRRASRRNRAEAVSALDAALTDLWGGM